MKIAVGRLRQLINEALTEAYYSHSPVKGTIYFPTPSALAIWEHNILGQLSDGAWENTRPEDHWRFWHDLTPALGNPGYEANGYPVKTGYNLQSLRQYIEDELLAMGRMGRAIGSQFSDYVASATNYMPDTYEEFVTAKNTGNWKYGHTAKYMTYVTNDMARKYYETTYTTKDLIRDLQMIKKAMKTTVDANSVKGAQQSQPVSGEQYYEYVGGNSAKFWAISVNGTDVHTRWGRIGSKGQEKTKTYSSPHEADMEAKKLITSKMNKGYEEAQPTG